MATTQIDVRELPNRLAEMVSLAAAGTEISVMEGNVPCAKLIPYPQRTTRVLGLHPGAMIAADDFDDPLPDEFWHSPVNAAR